MLEQTSDRDITQAIQQVFQTDKLMFSGQIDIQTKAGIVLLSGSVPNLQTIEQALILTTTIRGVRAVINRLECNSVPRADLDVARDIAAVLCCDPATYTTKIEIKVEAGVATLRGKVASWQKKELCGWIVKRVRGLWDVKNEIIVIYYGHRSDKDIQ